MATAWQRSSVTAGLDGAGAAQIAARYTRDRKELLSPEEVQLQHRELAVTFGHQADRVVAEARQRTRELQQERRLEIVARQAVTYARDHLFEKSAVQADELFMRPPCNVAWAK